MLPQIMSATCLFLASKAEESPRKLYDIVYYYCRLRLKSSRIITESVSLTQSSNVTSISRSISPHETSLTSIHILGTAGWIGTT